MPPNPLGVKLDMIVKCEVLLENCPDDMKNIYCNFCMISVPGCNVLEGKQLEDGNFHLDGKLMRSDHSKTYETELSDVVPFSKLASEGDRKVVKRYHLTRPSEETLQDYGMIWFYRCYDEETPGLSPFRRSTLLGCQMINLAALVNCEPGVSLEAMHSCAPLGVRCTVVRGCPPEVKLQNKPVWEAIQVYERYQQQAVDCLKKLENGTPGGWKGGGNVLRNSFFEGHDMECAKALMAEAKPSMQKSVLELEQAIAAMQGASAKPSVACYSGQINEMLELQQKCFQVVIPSLSLSLSLYLVLPFYALIFCLVTRKHLFLSTRIRD